MKTHRDTTAPGAGSDASPGGGGQFENVADKRRGSHHFARRIGHMSDFGRRDESGQSLVEFALVLPLVILIVAVAFNGWDGMQTSIRLTSAARAGAIVAASDLAAGDPQATVTTDTLNAINAEEGVTGVYQASSKSAPNYVDIETPPQQTLSSGATSVVVNVVTVTISPAAVTLVPYVGHISVTTHATARYS
jgi:Flp pilus assembly protein TadG